MAKRALEVESGDGEAEWHRRVCRRPKPVSLDWDDFLSRLPTDVFLTLRCEFGVVQRDGRWICIGRLEKSRCEELESRLENFFYTSQRASSAEVVRPATDFHYFYRDRAEFGTTSPCPPFSVVTRVFPCMERFFSLQQRWCYDARNPQTCRLYMVKVELWPTDETNFVDVNP